MKGHIVIKRIIKYKNHWEYVVFNDDGDQIAESCNTYESTDEAVQGARDLIKLLKNPDLAMLIDNK